MRYVRVTGRKKGLRIIEMCCKGKLEHLRQPGEPSLAKPPTAYTVIRYCIRTVPSACFRTRTTHGGLAGGQTCCQSSCRVSDCASMAPYSDRQIYFWLVHQGSYDYILRDVITTGLGSRYWDRLIKVRQCQPPRMPFKIRSYDYHTCTERDPPTFVVAGGYAES